jgi:hypothetical protein
MYESQVLMQLRMLRMNTLEGGVHAQHIDCNWESRAAYAQECPQLRRAVAVAVLPADLVQRRLLLG